MHLAPKTQDKLELQRSGVSPNRRGLTLVELLVTITILVILVGVTIPLMRSIRNGSQLEAAVRKIESLMNTAKATAITTGRPAGLIFIRDELDPSVAYEVAVAESPAPYAGERQGSRVLVFPGQANSTLKFPSHQEFQSGQTAQSYGYVRPLRVKQAGNQIDDPTNDQTKWFIRAGDEIRFNFQGPRYEIAQVNNETLVTLDVTLPLQLQGKWLEFQIFRAPRRTMAAPVELPQGAFVKLSSSGMSKDRSGLFLDPSRRLFTTGDVMLTFNPSGKLDRIYRGIPQQADETEVYNTQSANLDPELIAAKTSVRVTGPIRIDLGDGAPAAPTNAHRFMLNNRSDRSSKTIRVDQLALPLAAN